jgi:hypothetical protein
MIRSRRPIGLMGFLHAAIQATMRTMLDAGHGFPPGGPIAFRLGSDRRTRRARSLLRQSQHAFCHASSG